MLIDALSTLLHDYSYLILLLSIGLLGFSVGLRAPGLRAPLICEELIAKRSGLDAEHRRKHLGSRGRMQRGNREELRMNDDKRLEAMQREKMQVKQENREPIKEGKGLKQRIVKGSSSGPVWLRSLSLGRRNCSMNEQDSNPGRASEKSVQRKASLTGEEVKELADAFIARVRQRMRVQRQESLKLRPETSYEAPPLP